jgi:hypothetical protein
MTSLADSTVKLGERGLRVFPCWPKTKTPQFKDNLKLATVEPVIIRRWWSDAREDSNIGIATGRASGIWVTDEDGDEDLATMSRLEAEHGKLPKTVEVVTGGGGRHLYWRWRPDGREIRNFQCRDDLPGFDVRGEGGFVVAPPSIHPSGRAYAWSVDSAEPMAYILPKTMICLDVNALNRRRLLQEGSIINLGGTDPAAASSGQGQRLIAGVGVLHWAIGPLAYEGPVACEWEDVPIITRRAPPSWGANAYRARPRFRCSCDRGCYHLYLTRNGLRCRVCAQVPYPSRDDDRDPDAGLRLRLGKMRAELGAVSPFFDPPEPPGGPRTKWLFRKKLARLRATEWRLMGSIAALCDRMERRLARSK